MTIQYLDLLSNIMLNGTPRGDRTGTGTTALFGASIRYDLSEGFPLLTTKKLAMRLIAEELIWMLSGSTDEHVLRDKNVNIWAEWSTPEQCAKFGRKAGDLGPVYGKQFRSFGEWSSAKLQEVLPRKPSAVSKERHDVYRAGDGLYEILGNAGNDGEGRPLVLLRFTSGFERVVRADAERNSIPRDPYEPTVCGLGYLGEFDRSHPMLARLKKTWSHMLDRCYTESCKEYKYYGAKGITVCSRWLSFASFLSDATKIPGYSLLRSTPEDYHLDKDHFSSNVYSPETTMWIPRWVNRSYAHWRPFEATDPAGHAWRHGSASMFAELHGLDGHCVARCLRGERSHHKDWTFRLLPESSNLRYAHPVDQVAQVVEQLIISPSSRRIIITGWDPRVATQVALPPCHTLVQFDVDDGKLSCQLYMRSADVFLGVPYNTASYALLTHMLAQVTGLEVGDLIVSFGNVHIYNNHRDQVREQLERTPRPLPTLILDTNIKSIDDFEWKHIEMKGYDAYPTIKAEVSV